MLGHRRARGNPRPPSPTQRGPGNEVLSLVTRALLPYNPGCEANAFHNNGQEHSMAHDLSVYHWVG